MKMKLFPVLLLAVAVFGFSSCEKEYLVTVNGVVSGQATEMFTGAPVPDVTVTVLIDDTKSLTDVTDANGLYTIKNIPLGEYKITFTKAGYATVYSEIAIDLQMTDNTTIRKKESYVQGVARDVTMYSLNGKLEGQILEQNIPVSGATVMAYWYNSTVSATTDANGMYEFTNLPVGTQLSIAAYKGTSSGSYGNLWLDFDATIVSQSGYNFSINDNNLYLINYTGRGGVKVDTTGNLVLTFSEPVSEQITKAQGGYVSLSRGGWQTILVDVTYSGNTITISPVSGNLTSGTYYSIEFEVYASEYKSVYNDLSFYTKGSAASFTQAPVISYAVATGLELEELAEATSTDGNDIYYSLYYKSATDDDFVIIGSNYIYAPAVLDASPDPGSYYMVASVSGQDGVYVTSRSNVVVVPEP